MANNEWRNNLDLVIDKNLSELIKETKTYSSAIEKSEDKSKAQLWVALAILNHKINHLYSICNTDDKKKKQSSKISKEELNKILKTLETL